MEARGQDRAYRRAPQQERSRTTVDAIFEAASRLVDHAGLEGATTARIAHVAGVSIGSLYQYFPKKEALFTALTERAMERDLHRVRDAVDRTRDMPVEQGVREVLAAAFAFALERPRLFAWMLRYLPELGLLPAVERWERALIAETCRFLRMHHAELQAGGLVGQGRAAQERMPSAQERMPSAQERMPSAQERMPAAQERMPSAQERMPSAQERMPSAQELDLEVQAIAGVGAIRGALVLLARERPEALSEGKHMLGLATDMVLGTWMARRARTSEPPRPHNEPGEPRP